MILYIYLIYLFTGIERFHADCAALAEREKTQALHEDICYYIVIGLKRLDLSPSASSSIIILVVIYPYRSHIYLS